MSQTRYDDLVLGSGEAGKYLAWSLAKQGRRVAVIERRYLGGSCPNIACLPSKNLIYSAHVAALARRHAEFGLTTGPIAVDMAAVQARKRAMVDGLHQMHVDRFSASGAEVIYGEGRFTSPRTLEVALNEGDTLTLTAGRVFVNTGSRATIPPIPGLRESQPMTHIEALNLDRLPGHLLVLGGGYIGVELAQAFRRLGAQVTIVQRGPQLLNREDPEFAAAVLDLLRDEGIEVLLNTDVVKVTGQSGDTVEVTTISAGVERTVQATDILAAVGRTPNTDALGLEAAGIQRTPKGFVHVNARLETTASNAWAMGECAGTPAFTHASFDDFRIVRDNLDGGSRTTEGRLIPYCVFTDPPLARAGLNETDAQAQGIDYRIATLPMAAVLRTRTISEPRGLMKAVTEAATGRLLGFTAFGAESPELMAAMQVALVAGLFFDRLGDAVFAHPTIAEGLTFLVESGTHAPKARAAMAATAPPATPPPDTP